MGCAPERELTKEARNDLTFKPPTADEEDCRLSSIMMISMVLSMYVTPMAVGTNFAVLAYYWLQVYELGTATSGSLMAVGECLGVVLLFLMK